MKPKSIKFSLDDSSLEDDYRLIAIYSNEEDYRMAFLINYHFNFHFTKANAIIQSKTSAVFNVYEYEDKNYYRNWVLLHNYFLTQHVQVQSGGLFANMETVIEKPLFYIKELSKARFLLKIEADEPLAFFENFNQKLKSISQIYTAELVDLQQIKKPALLVF
jgi:hypothetical protein